MSVKNYSTANWRKYETTTQTWFVASVSTTYPEGSRVAGARADYRNDEKNTLAAYRISYAGETQDIYEITYAPATASVLEDHVTGIYYPVADMAPSMDIAVIGDLYVHHYTADEAIGGTHYSTRQSWMDGTADAVSGSGEQLNRWYRAGHGREIKGLKRLSAFPSVRRLHR